MWAEAMETGRGDGAGAGRRVGASEGREGDGHGVAPCLRCEQGVGGQRGLELRFEHDSGWGILGYPALFSEGYSRVSWGIRGILYCSGMLCR